MKLSLVAALSTICYSNAFTVYAPKSTFTIPKQQLQAKNVPEFDEVCDTVGVTLSRFMGEVALLNPELTELTSVFGAIDTACKAITNLVKRSQLPGSSTLGYEGAVNIQGEDQKVRFY